MSFLLPYSSQIIKFRISRFVALSWTSHLPILLTRKIGQDYLFLRHVDCYFESLFLEGRLNMRLFMPPSQFRIFQDLRFSTLGS